MAPLFASVWALYGQLAVRKVPLSNRTISSGWATRGTTLGASHLAGRSVLREIERDLGGSIEEAAANQSSTTPPG